MGEVLCYKGSCIVPGRFLLLLHILLWLSKATAAAAAGDYAASFSPEDTHNFWVSEPGGNFTFGFKLVDNGEYLLAIWHSLDAHQTPIWWAEFGDVNRSTNTVQKGASFDYTSLYGVLRLSDSASSMVWQSSNSTSTSTSLQFLDTGNLKLLQYNNSSVQVWQSFEDRRDSLMLTAGLEASWFLDKPLVLQSRSNQTSYVNGRFHMATYNSFDIHLFGLDALNRQYVYMKDYNVSLRISGDVVSVGNQIDGSAFVSGNSSLSRLSLDYDANLRVYRWASDTSTWVNVWALMVDSTLVCRAQAPCGPFGLCQTDSKNATQCSCPIGYTPISPSDLKQGCNSSRTSSICRQGKATNNTVMEEVQHADYYYNDLSWSSNINDIEMCKNACLSECACIAATYNSGSSMCFLKGNSTMGYLENGIVSSAGYTTLLMKLLQLPDASEGPSPPPDKKSRPSVAIIVVVVILSTSAFVVCIYVIWWWMRRTGRSDCYGRKQADNEAWFDAGPRKFSYQELLEATKNFSDLLGEGGFGAVFRGQIRDRQGEVGTSSELGMMVQVAVKVLKKLGSTKRAENIAVKQFRAEAGMLSKIHHVNLVSLLGYCIGGQAGEKRRLLVYEYMDNGCLDRYLSPEHMSEPLPWLVRYSIAVGTARGITYLHHDCNPRILHCDIKPQNVLLDKDFTPKVADFGLASYMEKLDESHLIVSGMRGTRGYMAPDWVRTDAITPKADVYSFGVLLLELVHGLKSVENMSLVAWAFQCLAAGTLVPDHEIVSATGSALPSMPAMPSSTEVEGEDDLKQQLRCLRVALWCVHGEPAQRPPMLQILQQLEGTCEIQDPPDPAAINGRKFSRVGSDSDATSNSNNAFSFSVVSGR